MITHILAWRPFLEPIDAHNWYALLLIPMALFIAIAYKAIRMKDLADDYLKQVAMFTVQTILGMAALAAGFFLLVEVYARWRQG